MKRTPQLCAVAFWVTTGLQSVLMFVHMLYVLNGNPELLRLDQFYGFCYTPAIGMDQWVIRTFEGQGRIAEWILVIVASLGPAVLVVAYSLIVGAVAFLVSRAAQGLVATSTKQNHG